MSETGSGGEGLKDRISARGEEAIGDFAESLLENPVFNQALQAAFGARDIATQAVQQAFKNLNVASVPDVERLGRRLRSISDRLEAVEDSIDQLARDVATIRKHVEPQVGSTSKPVEPVLGSSSDQEEPELDSPSKPKKPLFSEPVEDEGLFGEPERD